VSPPGMSKRVGAPTSPQAPRLPQDLAPDLGDWTVTWETTTDVGRFLAAAEPFLALDPVANNMLLTEARFWSRLSDPPGVARFGWWAETSEASAAFVHIPDHAPLCSPLSDASAALLPEELPDVSRLGVQPQNVAAVTAAWSSARQQVLRPCAQLTLLRLQDLHPRTLPTDGAPRVADASDLPLLRSWFDLFRERHPEDASHVEFVIDQPLRDGGVIVWEVHGRAIAMASRTPEVAGMVRMGLAFQPAGGTTYADAAFHIGCREAARTAEHVLVLSGSPESYAVYTSLGFAPVRVHVILEVDSA